MLEFEFDETILNDPTMIAILEQAENDGKTHTSSKNRSHTTSIVNSTAPNTPRPIPLCQGHRLDCALEFSLRYNHSIWRCAVMPYSSKCSTELSPSSHQLDIHMTHQQQQNRRSQNILKSQQKKLLVTLELGADETFSAQIYPIDDEFIKHIVFHDFTHRPNRADTFVLPLDKLESFITVCRHSPSQLSVRIDPIPPALVEIARNWKYALSYESAQREIESRIGTFLWNSLFPFQRDGVVFGVRSHGRVLIADEMGLGKTIQGISLCQYFRDDWPVLVVVPGNLRLMWRSALLNRLSHVHRRDVACIMKTKDIEQYIKLPNFTICSYASIGKILPLITKRWEGRYAPNVIVADESHKLQNSSSIRSRVLVPLMHKAKRVILMSGTPQFASPAGLFTQLNVLRRNVRVFSSKKSFTERYGVARRSTDGNHFFAPAHMLELNVVLRKTVMIRRLKRQVLTQLPPKRRQVVELDGAKISRVHHHHLHHHHHHHHHQTHNVRTLIMDAVARQRSDARTELTSLYLQTAEAKISLVNEFIDHLLLDSDEKFLVFAHHHTMLDGVEAHLRLRLQNAYIRIDGKTSACEREHRVKQFERNYETTRGATSPIPPRVALLSIQAASAGITLVAASIVVFAELHWTPANLLQAEDRVHRVGQKNACLIYYLIAKGTLDDIMWPVIISKLGNVATAIDGQERGFEMHRSQYTRTTLPV